MDSSTFKRFSSSVDNILENLEDVDFTQMGKLDLSVVSLLFIYLMSSSQFPDCRALYI